MRLSYVSPDVLTLSRVDFPPAGVSRDPINFDTVDTRLVYTPEGPGGGFRALVEPQWGLYELVFDSTPSPTPFQYYQRDPAGPLDAFRNADNTGPGTVGDATSIVQETWAWARISLNDLRAIKEDELEEYDAFVGVQPFRSTGNPNVWVFYDLLTRDTWNSRDRVLTDRMKDIVIGEDSNADPVVKKDPTTYWKRDLPVRLIRDSNGQRLVSDIPEKEWGQLMKDAGLYDEARTDAVIACGVDIGDAYDAAAADPGNTALQDALAAIDVQDPVYGWPTYYQGPISPTVKRL